MTIRIGTRGSALALAQAGTVAEALEAAAGTDVRLIPIASEGDVRDDSLSVIGGRGVFAGTLRRALASGDCDLVVHSLKDLPTAPAEGLSLASVPVRADARDVLCARDGLTLEQLPAGARVGTGSPRRIAQLLALRPDLQVVDIRGNVDTRLRFVADGALDAVVLAAAGVERLGRTDVITETLDLRRWPTAPGQGALALEVRETDLEHSEVAQAARVLADRDAELTVAAEREVLRGLEAGCTAPVAASSSFTGGVLAVWAAVYRPDGTASVQKHVEQDAAHGALDPFAAGRRLVAELLDAGAADLAPLGVSA